MTQASLTTFLRLNGALGVEIQTGRTSLHGENDVVASTKLFFLFDIAYVNQNCYCEDFNS